MRLPLSPRLALPALPIIAGALALIGWTWDIDFLKRGISSSVAMNPATAAGFILLALAALRLYAVINAPLINRFCWLAPLIVIIASAMKLSDLTLGTAFDIDQQLFSSKLAVEAGHPNRMAPNTAFCFFALGWAMLFLRKQSDCSIRIAQVLAVIPALIALMAIIGYSYGVKSLYGIGIYIPMAINTAVSFLFIAGALIFAYPDKGGARILTATGYSGLNIPILLSAVVFVPFLLGWLSFAGERAGFYDMTFAFALLVILNIAVLFLLAYISLRGMFLSNERKQKAETQLRIANVELQKNVERTQLMLDSALDGIISMDHHGTVIGWNIQAEHIFGYSCELALGRKIAELIVPPAYREQHRQGLSRFLATGKSNVIGTRLEITGLRADGSEFPIELAIDALGQKNNYFFIAFVRDITERRQMEEKLRENENRLNTILDNVEAYIYIKDCNYQYQYANQQVQQLFGRKPEDIIGKLDDVFFDEATVAKVRENDRRIIERGERIAIEDTYTRKDSAISRTYLTVKQPLRRKDGSIYGLCGISTDISERKQMENALRESEYRWKFAVEGSGDGLWDWSVADGTVFFSKRWKEMLGYTEDEIGCDLAEWEGRIHPDDKPETLAVVQAYFHGKIPAYSNEHRVKCKDGSWKWILDRGIVVSRDAEGKPLRMIGTHTDITGRKQMEEKLRDSDAFNVSILNSLTSHIAVLDARGIIVAVNNAWRQFAEENGLSESSRNMLGFNYLNACKSPVGQPYCDEAGEAETGIAAVLAGNLESFHLEYSCHSPQEQRWFYMNVSPLQGSRCGVVVSHENITERKKLEELAHAAAQYSRSLIEASLDPLVTISAKGKITDVNTATEQVTGVNRCNLVGSDFADYFTEPEKARAGYQQVFLEGFVTDYPLAIRHVSGKVTDVLYNASVYHDVNGNVLGVFAAARDVTERKQAELAKRNSENQLQAFYELDLVGLTVTSLEKGWIRINECLCRMLEYSEQELHQMTWTELTHPEDLAADVEQFEKLLANEINGYSLEKRFISRTGKIIPTKLVVRGVRKANGQLDYVMAMVEDITEYKRAETELKRSNAELEQFAYAVSHDMRQPLRMVTSYLSLIEQALAGKLDEDTQQFFDFAVNGAKRMDAMILSLLDYSRVGRKSESKARISSKASLDEALAFLRPEIDACNGNVKVTGDWPELFASPDELTRLLQNLIGNALKYRLENQAPQVHIHGAAGAGSLRVEVRDQGIGIDPSQRDRLFKVFSRLQARSRFEGTGVGLALCRKIVEHHGGTIGVESSGEGHGCVFWFELPLANTQNSE